MSEFEEAAKAAQEAARLGQSIVTNIDPLSRIANRILGPIGQVYGLLTDLTFHAREEVNWRISNRKTIYRIAHDKAQRISLELDSIQPIPKSIAISYREQMDISEDPTLQEMWANLLVNVGSPTSGIDPMKFFGRLLGEIEPLDAIFFNEIAMRAESVRAYYIICDIVEGDEVVGTEVGYIVPPEIFNKATSPILSTDMFKFSDESIFVRKLEREIEACVDRLQALGLLERSSRQHLAQEMFESEVRARPPRNFSELGLRVLEHAEGIEIFQMSELGRQFADAVADPQKYLET